MQIDSRPFHQLLRSAINNSAKVGNARQLAAASGISEAMIGQYLREEDPKLPGLANIMRMVQALGTTPNQLMGYREAETETWKRRYMRLYVPAMGLRDAVEADLRDKGVSGILSRCPTPPNLPTA